MPQSIKRRSSFSAAISTVASQPQRLLSGMKYRLHRWTATPAKAISDNVAHTLAEEDTTFKSMSFTFAVIAISAKIACADGELTKEKYVAFRDSFPLNGDMCEKIRSLFTLACRNQTPLAHYVAQIKHIFPQNTALFAALLDRLFCIATTDNELSGQAEKLLSAVAHGLDISAADYARIHSLYTSESKLARRVMGVDASIQPNHLKKRYHELMQRYHPDRFATQDLSPEIRMLLQLKTSEINDAYRTLSRT